MKKFLSLVLALVMTMSLVTISAGAKDFTDDSKITYKEAVDVMSAVKVVDGYTDGSFNPSATLTRGAAAKIICNMILGPTTAGALKADAAPYKDVPADSTFAGYIAYCAKEGIISGYADGTFKPGNTLTGYAFMKMLLGALGYDKATEGYEGANWSINVAKRALAIDLDDGLVGDFDGTKPVTRQEACLFALNTLTATMVKYDNASTITVGDIVISTNSKSEPVAQDGYSNNMGAANLQFAEKYFTNLKLKLDKDDFGRPANEWKLKNTEIGTYGFEADVIYTAEVKGEEIVDDMDDADGYKFVYYVDGTDNAGTFQVNDDSTKFYYKNGVVQEFFLDDPNYGYIVVTNPTLAEVDEIKEDKDGRYAVINVQDDVSATTSDITDSKFYTEEFEEGDMLIVTVANGAVKTAVAVEKQTGEVTKKVGSDTVYIDGTKYTLSDSTGGYKNVPGVGKDADYYVDQNGYILWIDAADETVDVSKFAYIEDAGTERGTWATLRFTDGTKKNVDSYKDYSSLEHYVVSYKVESDGSYKLTQQSDKASTYYYVSGGISKNSPNITITDATNAPKTIKTNSKTVFLYAINDGTDVSYKQVVGYKNAIELETINDGTSDIAYVLDGSVVSFAYIEVNKSDVKSNVNDKMTFIARDDADKVEEDDDVVYYVLNAIVDGEITTLKVDDLDDVTGYYVYESLQLDSDDIVDASEGTASAGTDYYSLSKIEKADNDTITVTPDGGSETTYALADDVAVFFIDKDANITEKSVGNIREATFGGSRYVYGVITLNDDGEIDMIVIKTK